MSPQLLRQCNDVGAVMKLLGFFGSTPYQLLSQDEWQRDIARIVAVVRRREQERPVPWWRRLWGMLRTEVVPPETT